jgi:hypothetical protein
MGQAILAASAHTAIAAPGGSPALPAGGAAPLLAALPAGAMPPVPGPGASPVPSPAPRAKTMAPAQTVTQAAAQTAGLAPGAVSAGAAEAPDAEAIFLRALGLALEDPRAAAIDYARAALAGHARAAYYLGQIYETGDGVPVDFTIARHWYEVASLAHPRAERRLAELPQAEAGAFAPPLALLAERVAGGGADFVWTSGPGADPAAYVVELSADTRTGAVTAYQVAGSAARLPLAAPASHWRVLALDAAGGQAAASDWRPIPQAGGSDSAQAPPAGNPARSDAAAEAPRFHGKAGASATAVAGLLP